MFGRIQGKYMKNNVMNNLGKIIRIIGKLIEVIPRQFHAEPNVPSGHASTH